MGQAVRIDLMRPFFFSNKSNSSKVSIGLYGHHVVNVEMFNIVLNVTIDEENYVLIDLYNPATENEKPEVLDLVNYDENYQHKPKLEPLPLLEILFSFSKVWCKND